MTKSRTYIATPPGATIKEQLDDRGMTQKELAARMGYSQKHVTQLIKGDVQLTQDTALRLEMVLGVPARFWNNLESIYREKLQAVQEENLMDEDIAIAKRFPYAEIAKQGWVAAASSWPKKVTELRKYFEVANLSLLDAGQLVPQIACRRQSESGEADYALLAWAQQAKREARSLEVSKANVQGLQQCLPRLRSMTSEDPAKFCDELVNAFAECGVALVFLPHIKGSFLHGATFYDGAKIVMGLTVRGKDSDKFWFSLLHEVAHVVYGHIDQAAGTTDEDEKAADRFAADTLIPPADYAAFVGKGDFRAISIRSFAQEAGIDPGIVVGRLQKEGLVPFNRLNSLKKRYAIVA